MQLRHVAYDNLNHWRYMVDAHIASQQFDAALPDRICIPGWRLSLRVTILLLVICCAVALSCYTSFSTAINFCRILLALACNSAMLLREYIYFCLYTFFKRVSASLRSRMLARRFLVASKSFLNDAIMPVALCWLCCDLTSCFLTFLFLTCALCTAFFQSLSTSS